MIRFWNSASQHSFLYICVVCIKFYNNSIHSFKIEFLIGLSFERPYLIRGQNRNLITFGNPRFSSKTVVFSQNPRFSVKGVNIFSLSLERPNLMTGHFQNLTTFLKSTDFKENLQFSVKVADFESKNHRKSVNFTEICRFQQIPG